jgi:hypothetical protein
MIQLKVGRIDATAAGAFGVPGPGDGLASQKADFARAGFSPTEMIQAVWVTSFTGIFVDLTGFVALVDTHLVEFIIVTLQELVCLPYSNVYFKANDSSWEPAKIRVCAS